MVISASQVAVKMTNIGLTSNKLLLLTIKEYKNVNLTGSYSLGAKQMERGRNGEGLPEHTKK